MASARCSTVFLCSAMLSWVSHLQAVRFESEDEKLKVVDGSEVDEEVDDPVTQAETWERSQIFGSQEKASLLQKSGPMLDQLGGELDAHFETLLRGKTKSSTLDLGSKALEKALRKIMDDFVKKQPPQTGVWEEDKLNARIGFLKPNNRAAGMSPSVYQSPTKLFAIMLLAWHPGGCSNLHAHGQEVGHCAVQYVQGNVVESRYVFKNADDNMKRLDDFLALSQMIKDDPQNTAGSYTLTVSDLEKSYAETGEGAYYIDDRSGLHQLCNKNVDDEVDRALASKNETWLQKAVKDSTAFGYSVHLYWTPYLTWFDYGKKNGSMDPDFDAGIRLTFRRWLNMGAVPLEGKNATDMQKYEDEAKQRHANHLYADNCLKALGEGHADRAKYEELRENRRCEYSHTSGSFLGCDDVEQAHPCPVNSHSKRAELLKNEVESTKTNARNQWSKVKAAIPTLLKLKSLASPDEFDDAIGGANSVDNNGRSS